MRPSCNFCPAIVILGLLVCGISGERRDKLDCSVENSSVSGKFSGFVCNFTYNSNDKNGSQMEAQSSQTGASPLKNLVKGPADLGIYYVNSPGLSCGGLKTAQCSTSCGALGYPVYWCYPKVCYCHYGSRETNEIDDIILPSTAAT